jgi:hypothetical protein
LRGENGKREGVKRMKGRNICVGDQINIPAEVIALVNDGFDAFAVIKAGKEYVMMDADALMSIKYGGEE